MSDSNILIDLMFPLVSADVKSSKAKERNIRALNRMGDAQLLAMKEEEKTMKALARLGNRKKGIVLTSLNKFLTLYERIMAVDFEESDEIKGLFAGTISHRELVSYKQGISVSGFNMSNGELILTSLWDMRRVIQKEADLEVKTANMRMKQARAVEAHAQLQAVGLKVIYESANRMTDILSELNLMFVKSLSYTGGIIEKNGRDRRNYSAEEKSGIRTCINLASSI